MAKQGHPELLGIHVNLPGTVPPDIIKAIAAGDPPPSSLSRRVRAYQQIALAFERRAYAQIMGTRPQTLYGLATAVAGRRMMDHGDG